jgi:inhibitor of cysteine peptidase
MRAAWLVVAGALGCATTGQAPPASPPRITVSESGGPVALAVGQELAVQLESNVTTGYAWELVPPMPDALTVIDPGTYRASSGSESRPGSGGTTSFVVRAARPGNGTLELVYRRPWESGTPPTRAVRVEVTVR